MPNFKENKSAFMMKGKSPMMKALVGKQGNLPVDLQKEILAAPTKMYGKSPMKKDTGEVVSKNSPGAGWTKTKGTNIWAPPVGDNEMFGKMKGELVKKSTKTITNKKSMKPPYKKPVGPRA
mgnify:CR=1 FL=1